MLILDVEKQTGLDRATIRYYEKESLVVPGRSENGYRSYTEEDVNLLLKIKLLRQLGVSLQKIKMLQHGSGDFSQIMAEQIKVLEQKIQENTGAVRVCKMIQQDDAKYFNLNSAYYLDMLSVPTVIPTHHFVEESARVSHPWRRYFARYLDYRLLFAGIMLLLSVVLRIRPISSNVIKILNYAVGIIAIPLLALMLRYWGTTPGKWVMGIRLESIHGGKLSGGEALYREGKIIWHGLGLFIPIVDIWRNYRSYRNEKEGIEHAWDEDTEVIYTPWTRWKKAAAAALMVGSLLISIFSGFSLVMPTHRGEITVSEFAENHRDYEKMMNIYSSFLLNGEGKWAENPNVWSSEADRPDFNYKLNENEEITSIEYENSWENADMINVIPSYCESAICTIVGSRPNTSCKDMVMVGRLLEQEIYAKIMQAGEYTGSFIIEDVKVSWTIQLENCDFVSYGVLFAKEGMRMSYRLKLRIEIT